MARINDSNNEGLYQFRIALHSIYDMHVYYEHMKDDYSHLKDILDGIEKLDTSAWGEVKKAYKIWIIKDIGQYLERIKPDEINDKGP